MNKKIQISTEFIRLDQLLKYAGAAASGGDAKNYILSGEVFLNGETCMQRGKKIYPGDLVKLKGDIFEIEKKVNS